MHQQIRSVDETSKALASLNDLGDDANMQQLQLPSSEDPAVVARWMLDVIEQISAYDDHAVSHLVTGFLKHACGQRLLSVEKTAMHISGLAHRVGEKFSLSDEGTTLMQVLAFNPRPAEGKREEEPQIVSVSQVDRSPFAKLNFGQQSFEIAEGDAENELVFRASPADQNWIKLRNRRECGWDVIGAEILKHSMDVFDAYVNQHSIRLDDVKVGKGIHVFEIDNIRWWLRVNGSSAEFTTDIRGNWTKIPASIQASSIRALGIAAARELVPDFKARLQPDAEAWILRMAHAAAITPIM